MKGINPLVIMISITVFISGCATNQISSTSGGNPLCFFTTTGAGGVLGFAVDDEPEVVAAGAIIGGLVGYFLCGGEADNDSDGDGVTDSNDLCPGTARGVAVNSSGCPIDSDGDGVTDNNDQCPGTARGVRVNASGCPLDSDGDGVTDNNDRCPATPRGAAVNSTGCQPDSDADGVVDSIDNCPATPRGQAVNEVGCNTIFSLEGVNFATNSADLTPAAEDKLQLAVQMLRENSNINVRVEGYTDSAGSDSYNLQLSQRRAQSVVDYLAARGINRGRMTPTGRGESSPIATNETEQGRARNRRVDISINN